MVKRGPTDLFTHTELDNPPPPPRLYWQDQGNEFIHSAEESRGEERVVTLLSLLLLLLRCDVDDDCSLIYMRAYGRTAKNC